MIQVQSVCMLVFAFAFAACLRNTKLPAGEKGQELLIEYGLELEF